MKNDIINAPVPHGSICCTYHQLKYLSPNRKKTTTKTRATQKSRTFEKMEVYGKISQKNGAKAEKDKTERATGLGRITEEEI